ncbi:MAG: 5'/3'-nucleotidase SurE [Alphaproteobacteria bacterium]|nr:5'/3'-nucleotidase SurE [Alphaproteobacteria bacterium]
MTARPRTFLADLRRARVLLTNDDGYDAAGLACLRTIVAGLCDDVWVVAPETNQSGAGHSLTLRRPLRITERGEKRYSVDGTPTDCVLLAINRIMADHRPDFVFSGVNHGTNLGDDVTYSGTVSAALEAEVLGVPSIAFSQELDEAGATDWACARDGLAGLVRTLVARGWPSDTLINVNFPREASGVAVTRLARHKVGDQTVPESDASGETRFWIGDMHTTEPGDGTDVAAVAAGLVSITPLMLDITDYRTLADLAAALG